MPLILGIESTCDETAAAVVEDGVRVRSSVIASQADIHARYRGVVPEIASRAHIESILPVIHDALAQANVGLRDVDAIAVTSRPGLIGSLLIGVTAAKTLAWSLNKPLISVDHVQAHLYSVMLDASAIENRKSKIENPAVGLAISGGHTALYSLKSFSDIQLIGSTIDDAIGEAYDKVAFILGLGYPGGPIIDRLAQTGDPEAIHFPRSTLTRTSLDFSFSGLKTSVLYHVRGHKGKERTVADLTPQQIADVAASFQDACIDVVLTKLKRAIKQTHARSVIIGGGVSANSGLRTATANGIQIPSDSSPQRGRGGREGVFHPSIENRESRISNLPVFFPPPAYCTDNAAMSAGLAYLKWHRQDFAGLDLDAITHSELVRAHV